MNNNVKDAAINICKLERYGELYPDRVVWTDIDYYKAGGISAAIKDIKNRQMVDGITVADQVMLQILGYAMHCP